MIYFIFKSKILKNKIKIFKKEEKYLSENNSIYNHHSIRYKLILLYKYNII